MTRATSRATLARVCARLGLCAAFMLTAWAMVEIFGWFRPAFLP